MQEVVKPVRVKRRHSEAFKQAVVAACAEPGASLSGIARANGVNANLVRKWMDQRGVARSTRRAVSAEVVSAPNTPAPAFLPVGVEPSPPSAPNIQIEIHRGATALTIRWPVEAAQACATWLGAWLR